MSTKPQPTCDFQFRYQVTPKDSDHVPPIVESKIGSSLGLQVDVAVDLSTNGWRKAHPAATTLSSPSAMAGPWATPAMARSR